MKKIWGLILSVLFALSYAGPASALDLDAVRLALLNQGAGWRAANTSMSRLTPKERLTRLGLSIRSHDRDIPEDPLAFVTFGEDLPSRFDWRDFDAVSPVVDQGNCGSCWAFAIVAALESTLLVEGFAMQDLSEQFLVSYSLLNRGCRGGSLWTAAGFAKRIGTVEETCLPYRADGRKFPPPCPEWPTDRTGAVAWHHIPRSIGDLKAAVYEGPVAAGFYVHEDFYFYQRGIYSHVTGDPVGGHAVLIVGWDDEEQCFIAKNSWGPEWGESGFFRIAYTEVSNEVAFGSDAVLLLGIWSAS